MSARLKLISLYKNAEILMADRSSCRTKDCLSDVAALRDSSLSAYATHLKAPTYLLSIAEDTLLSIVTALSYVVSILNIETKSNTEILLM